MDQESIGSGGGQGTGGDTRSSTDFNSTEGGSNS